VAAIYLVAVAVHLGLSLRMAGPVVQGDEGAYLGTAGLLARGVGLLFRQSPYQPGWGLLLWPVERLTADPTVLYRSALVLNALALGALPVLVYGLSRWLVDPRAVGRRTAVALAVAAYPAYLAYSNLALEVSVFVPLCTLTAWALARCAERPSWRRWAVVGLLAGACYAVHALGTVVVVAVLAIALLARRPLHERLPAVVGCLAGIEVSSVASLVLLRHVIAYDRRISATPAATVVSRTQAVIGLYNHNATVPGHAVRLVYEVAGQVWYLTAATAGLLVLGVVVAAGAGWRVFVRRSRHPADFIATFAGLIFVLGLYSSANRFIVGARGTGQADALIYGRYNEHLLVPLLVVAVAYLSQQALRWREVLGWTTAVAVALAVGGGLLVLGRTGAALRAPIVFVNVLGLQPALHLAGRMDVPALSAGAALAALAVFSLAVARRPTALAVVLVAAGLASAGFSAASMVSDSRQRAVQRVVIHAVGLADRLTGGERCIAYDLPLGMEWTLANDQTFLPRKEMKPFDSRGRQPPCSDLVISQRLDLDRTYPGARLMAAEDYAPTYLWVLPGPALDRLAAAGMLLPPAFPAALPAGAYVSGLAVVGAPPTVARAGRRVDLRLAVTNRGRGAPWPSQRGFTAGDGWVSLAVAWTPIGAPAPPLATLSAGAARFELARELWPGETVDQTLAISARAGGRPLAPGRYQVTVGLVQDGESYFAAHDDQPLHLFVDVR